MSATSSSSAGRPVLPARRLLHRPVAAGRSRRHHARARRPRAARPRPLPRRGAGRRRAAHAPRRRSTCRRCPTARRSTTTASRCRLHPAGHVLGSAQVRLEHGGRVWVASGDYYVAGAAPMRARTTRPARRSSRCAATASSPNRPSACRSTAGSRRRELFADDRRLVARQRRRRPRQPAAGLQLRQGAAHPDRRRPLDRADRRARRGRAAEPRLPRRRRRRCRDDADRRPRSRTRRCFARALVVAPPSAQGSTWTRRFGDYSDAFASGWMQLRGARRRRAVDRGFVLSDHADWPGLQRAIAATGAERVIVTHGYEAVMVRWLERAGPARRAPSRPSTAGRRRAPRRARRGGRGFRAAAEHVAESVSDAEAARDRRRAGGRAGRRRRRMKRFARLFAELDAAPRRSPRSTR